MSTIDKFKPVKILSNKISKSDIHQGLWLKKPQSKSVLQPKFSIPAQVAAWDQLHLWEQFDLLHKRVAWTDET